ncbi:Protoporphyrinogen oxidase [Chitinophaga sp. YR573]|uniref:NAD(P)/FAD-dependent oxidoreductase n=1 Tax=Chitinophaga sp. YR573 TaxID=1881040 RepID=UPI0008BF05BB|nr:NAD(P)/FAD-dependent oxidoreductase [Chitinophaga sp. YR573]SEW03881.1 Protoporphyrinogen oxidase [Chitinophaga sp. YR573]
MDATNKKAIIIGAGPAGLTAAYELLKRTDIIPIIVEKSGDVGGISKTINYKGNRMDIGGHRFFSKSDRVMHWWLNILPLQQGERQPFTIKYQNKSKNINTSELSNEEQITDPDKVMLVRKRLSRIYFLRRFFTYPITLSIETLHKLGIARTITILFSYLKAQLFPRRREKSLEDFMINRFGKTLYELFFRDYTEKVWGVPCNEISAEWGAQRIKGVSIKKAIQHAIQEVTKKKNTSDITQKDTETSLIEQFLYPKFGPGQLWEEVARQVQGMGGIIQLHHDVKHIHTSGNIVTAITVVNRETGEELQLAGDYFFSTMPVKELIAGIIGVIPENVQEIANGLQYRDFITVGILLQRLSFQDKQSGEWKPLRLQDTWIYIQEKDVKVGRLQLFNNWSPYMVKDPDTVWVGMEFFCNETDDFWKQSDARIVELAIQELEKIGLATVENVLDSTVLRMEKTYPAYFGAYEHFDIIRAYTDQLANLFLIGRNGMHKYNNADHSMLTAMVAVDNIVAGIASKENIWAINTEQEYNEENVTEEGKPKTAQHSFKDFILCVNWNKTMLWIAGIVVLLQFIVFKYLYFTPGFVDGDSYVYLETAFHNLNINTYPIGYSKFLRIFSAFTKSDIALVGFQYLLLQGSSLFFIFTLAWLYKPGKVAFAILFCCMVFNPAFLYMSNYVTSDALFLGLSLIWFTLLLWILHRPTPRLIIIHAVIILLAFTVRYNALFYPIVGAIAFLLSRQPLRMKIGGIVASILLIAGFMYHTSNQYNKLTGIRQFSPFSGWQMANNALYVYRFLQDKKLPNLPPDFKQLDHTVRTYFDTTRNIYAHPQEMLIANTWYMWDPKSPLQIYMNQQFKNDSTASSLKKWATVGPLYADYGAYLIKQYPATFALFYLLPNFMKYYAPPVEFLDTYNMGKDSIRPMGQIWFGLKNAKVNTHFKNPKVTVLGFYPVLVGILNVVFLFGLVGFAMLKGFKRQKLLSSGLLLVFGLWLVNFGFSVFASQIALRFQMLPVLVFMSFAVLLIEYVWKQAFTEEKQTSKK